ncbi:hypothetical protein RBH26_05175 [Natronolimnohabitans sp. A-GB9]|uniref:DUF7541 family protein n=1 Tax=Natronolimnohabitans sp. A-GB9 TaxID=3069757 RepID=UPI0027B553F9|nr:hypothetical protein [Natronolimnohabitans sp. A-GB9]MDQ2049869.1 hypothetical protein [Natronolimnohabitans sp. A-GB9]
MADHSSANDRERPTASPWPVLIALGLAGSEIGIILDLFPVAVGGLVLFAGSVGGILAESDHASSPLPVAAGFGVLFVLVGGVLYALATGAFSTDGFAGLATRGLVLVVAGVITLVGTALVRYRR